MMKRFLAAAAVLLAALAGAAPTFAQAVGNGAITSQDAGSCATATACLVFQVPLAAPAITLAVSGTFSGTLTVEGQSDSTNYYGLQATKLADGTQVTTITGTGLYSIANRGLLRIRLRAGAFASGTATVYAVQGAVGAGDASTTVSGSFSGNAAASATAAAVPASADYQGINIGGTLTGQTGVSVGTARAAAVAIVDGSGNQITSLGGGTQFAEDLAHTTADVGNEILCVRRDTTSTVSSGTAGDYSTCNVDANGRLYVNSTPYNSSGTEIGTSSNPIQVTLANTGANTTAVKVDGSAVTQPVSLASVPSHAVTNAGTFAVQCSNCTGSGVSVNEDVASANADPGTPAYSVRQDTPAGTTSADGDYQPLKSDSLGRLWMNCATGCSGGTQFAEDIAHTTADVGSEILCVRRDTTPSSSSGTAGDYSTCNVDANGRLYTNSTLYDSSGTAVPLATGGSGTIDSNTTRVTIATDDPVNDALVKLDAAIVIEDAAETAAANLVGVGTVRRDTAASSAGTTGDNATANTDANGLLWTRTFDPCSALAKTTTAISLTTDTVIISATASKKNYICSLSVVAGAAEIVSITEGTGSVCGTGEAALVGSTTDANGMSFAANGGLAAIGGNATVIAGITANVDTCLNVSGSNRVSGFVTWVQAP